MLTGNVSPRHIQAAEIQKLREENQQLKEKIKNIEKVAEDRLKAMRQLGSTNLSSRFFVWGITAGVFLTRAIELTWEWITSNQE